jgi:hypothetical protein
MKQELEGGQWKKQKAPADGLAGAFWLKEELG